MSVVIAARAAYLAACAAGSPQELRYLLWIAYDAARDAVFNPEVYRVD